uniref:Uncharacterized protein n=1 Tax=Aplanochytrium stocchinoi TaxID=215587 RepID=A0A7S3PIE9_9STRA
MSAAGAASHLEAQSIAVRKGISSNGFHVDPNMEVEAEPESRDTLETLSRNTSSNRSQASQISSVSSPTKSDNSKTSQRVNAWGHEEEVILVGAVTDRWLKRGSLAMSREKGKKEKNSMEDDCWVDIKKTYDKNWEDYIQAGGTVRPPQRSCNALSRHFKVMKARMTEAGNDDDFRKYYFEWEAKYNKEGSGFLNFLKNTNALPKPELQSTSVVPDNGINSGFALSGSHDLMHVLDLDGGKSEYKSTGQGRFKRQMRDGGPSYPSRYQTVSGSAGVHLARELKIKLESNRRNDNRAMHINSNPDERINGSHGSKDSSHSSRKGGGNHGNVFELFGLQNAERTNVAKAPSEPKNNYDVLDELGSVINLIDHQSHVDRFVSSPQFGSPLTDPYLIDSSNSYYNTVAGTDGLHMAEQLRHEQDAYHRSMQYSHHHHHQQQQLLQQQQQQPHDQQQLHHMPEEHDRGEKSHKHGFLNTIRNRTSRIFRHHH